MSIPKIIVIEGADGTGKTTAVTVARAMLALANVRATTFAHERRGGSDNLYVAALDYAHQRAGAFLATDYGDTEVILCDRWWHSSHVEAFRLSDSAIGNLVYAEEIALPRPSLVIVLDAHDAIINARMTARGEKVTQADRDRRSIYRECAGPAHAWDGESIMRGKSPPVIVVDSSGAVEDTAKRVATEVLRAMGRPVVGWDGDGREVACVG